MIALMLLIGLLIYIGLAALLTFLIRRRFTASRAKSIATIVTVLAFILIPTADEFAGKWYFDSLCGKEAGAKTSKSIEGVEGMINPSFPLSELEKMGYRFHEFQFIGKFYRSGRDSSGKEIEREIQQPSSRYAVKRGPWQKVRLGVSKYEELIVDVQTNETLGRYATFSYGGGWVADVLRSFGLTGGITCQLPPNTQREFYLNTLKPSKVSSSGK